MPFIPACSPLETAAGAVILLRQKHSLKNVHGLTEPKGISLPPTPTVLLLSLESICLIQPHRSPGAATWAGLGAGTERGTSQFNRLLKYLFSFHSLNVNSKTESQAAHRISEIIPFPAVLLQNTKLIGFPRRVLFGRAFLGAHKSKG